MHKIDISVKFKAMSNQGVWFIVNIVPVCIYGLLEAMHAFPVYFYQISGFSILLALLLSRIIAGKKTTSADWWNFSLLPLTTYVSVIAYSVLLNSAGLVHALYLLATVFVLLYFRTYFYFLRRSSRYRMASIRNSASYLNFFNFFLLSSSLYGFQSFLSLKDWQFIVIVGIYALVVFHQLFWALKIKIQESYKYILLATIVIIEVALAVSFLPFDYNVSGLLIALCYYAISSLYGLHIANELRADRIRYYILFIFMVFSIIFLTVRWL